MVFFYFLKLENDEFNKYVNFIKFHADIHDESIVMKVLPFVKKNLDMKQFLKSWINK
jgi:hypothetical protein